MKKKLLVFVAVAAIGLFVGISLAQPQEKERPPGREDRFRDWQERRREAADADARVALESRLVKLEEGLANYNRRLDWMEKVAWGAIVGILGLFGREVLAVYFSRQHRRQPDRDSQAGPE